MTRTPTRLILLTTAATLAFSGLVPTLAAAQDAPATFEECAGVPDDVERLACYDEVANARVPDTIRAMKEAKAEQQKREFGLFTPGPGQVLDELTVTVVKAERNKLRKMVLTMDDGAVWEQADTKNVFYPKTLTGKIEKGMMGAYFFTPDSGEVPIKVKRVK